MKYIMYEKWLIVFLLFVFSVLLRLWNLNEMGRTWDEPAQIIDGYKFIQLIKERDFNNSYWYDHPYHPPLTKYIYGFTGQFDKKSNEKSKEPYFSYGEPTFHYDYTWSRVASILFASASVALVVLIGIEYFSFFVGVAAGLILAMLPFFLGLSQLATIESVLMFFFTATIYSFLKFLKSFSLKTTIITGIMLGLAMETKYTNALLYPLLIWIYWIWRESNDLRKGLMDKRIFYIFFISFLVFILLWPMPWLHLQQIIALNYDLRVAQTAYSVPEVFFGKLLLVPKPYYIVQFLITTPILILILFGLGLFSIRKRTWSYSPKKISIKNGVQFLKECFLITHKSKSIWIYYVLVAWFCFPFIQSLYNFRQHGVRYIIEIYAPLSLLSAIGLQYTTNKVSKKTIVRIIAILLLCSYLFIVLLRISPYYLDYFNSVVGGTKTVYEKKMFQIGWWGQGVKAAGVYIIKHAKPGEKIGMAVEPLESVPKSEKLFYEKYSSAKQYDYVLVGHYNIIREGFHDGLVRKHYNPVYKVMGDGAILVTVYKKK